MKRIIVATLSGILCGFICYTMASSSGELAFPVTLQIIASRTLIGFAIGISCVRLHWTLHGIIMGIMFSIPLAISGLMAPESPEFSKTMMLVSTIVMGLIYGLLIEIITSFIFQAKQK
ncbi:MAG: hypothetical protein IMY72_07155 [Bacteroidetes bacterium]|nr:hypothetical protein [Bacteroidota bacterium]